jgi:hypothetical protein
MERAKDWGAAKFKALGFTNIKVEQFAKPSWTRGEESAELVAPYPMKLASSAWAAPCRRRPAASRPTSPCSRPMPT